MRVSSAAVALRGSILLGLVPLAVFAVAMAYVSAQVSIDGAIVLRGTVESAAPPVPVQSAEPGVLARAAVTAGQTVRRGDKIAELDASALVSEHEAVLREGFENALRRDLFLAERDDRPALSVTCCTASAFFDPPWAAERIAATIALFAARQASHRAEVDTALLRAREAAARGAGLSAENSALQRRAALVAADQAALDRLQAAGLALSARLGASAREALDTAAAMERNAAAIEASRLVEEIAEQEAEARSALRRRGAEEALAELSRAAVEIEVRRATVEARLGRMHILAPVDGTVADLPPDTGAVVGAGQVIVRIAPAGTGLRVVARLDPRDLDAAHPGQPARLRLTAFPGTTTPDVPATVTALSVLPGHDDRSGALYYEVFLAPDPAALASLPEPGLLPAMPAEVFLITTPRTPLSFVGRALSDYFARALRPG
ncbi:HlyD family secretion protein [Albidovulum sediminis]|uniref:HlyD family secretion protein n=1 Tax=Albidovulum sediminis TaxID=3066345 RepID=A0ABT2NNN3_9RHOB|nr:HlyD family secretion protein [Defluviimonas sediminis]MCT8330552.1 HlyD family secretion protein [Defluviimonas sediminis]